MSMKISLRSKGNLNRLVQEVNKQNSIKRNWNCKLFVLINCFLPFLYLENEKTVARRLKMLSFCTRGDLR